MTWRKGSGCECALLILMWFCVCFLPVNGWSAAMEKVANEKKVSDMQTIRPQFEKALQLAEAQNWQEAESILQKLHNTLPDNRAITNNLAVVYFYQGRMDRAQQLLGSVLVSDPKTRILFLNLQMLYGYNTAEAYRQGLGSNEKTSMPRLLLSHDPPSSSATAPLHEK